RLEPLPPPPRKVIPLVQEAPGPGVDSARVDTLPAQAATAAQSSATQEDFAATAVSRPISETVQARPPGFCTGCPERPIFSAMKLVERELGTHHVSADIGCHLFSILPPFNI